jgi:hypothetical protein
MVLSAITIPIHTIHLSPGSHLLIENISWEEYEALLDELGEDHHIPQINYYGTILELMALPMY